MSNEEHVRRTKIVQQIKELHREIQVQQYELAHKYDRLDNLYQLLDKPQDSFSQNHEEPSEKAASKEIPSAGFSEKTLRELQKYKSPERIKWWKFFWK
ncbi:hypothetical protein FC19_GL000610 [Liquorilactobacillus aquaticus DSM 21051]|uniref:DUF536 domain-containing protein n=1 Tax=Liquorilactobacillus aquaticus DSM 21051 TaxID=1423725 RepID=A0A0R2D8G7_9LACO|nr:hypothetical protein [Liquorilactobacillus aquaticus]KRM96323.1 hypothetical protein FC19_GL000610 [Liquorilactobacillus aquaticus DSM 21051]